MNGKKVMVFGMARSGIACAKLLLLRGAEVTICDSKAEDAFGGKLDEIKAAGARFLLDEKHPENSFVRVTDWAGKANDPGVPSMYFTLDPDTKKVKGMGIYSSKNMG